MRIDIHRDKQAGRQARQNSNLIIDATNSIIFFELILKFYSVQFKVDEYDQFGVDVDLPSLPSPLLLRCKFDGKKGEFCLVQFFSYCC